MKQKTKPKQKTLVIEGPEEKMMSYKILQLNNKNTGFQDLWMY